MAVRRYDGGVTSCTPRTFALAALLMAQPATTQSSSARADEAANAQRAAMAKLAFLVGTWSGSVSVRQGPGEPMHLTQTEHVQTKLDGLILLIEGSSRDADGKVLFQALATVSYDSAAAAYRFRAYNDGRYLDTELKVPDAGFSWGYQAGPALISNRMHLTDAGEWAETTDAAISSGAPRRSVEMLLKKQP